jgi:hypothetical protein
LLKEAMSINRSLAALGQVILSLSQRIKEPEKKIHIPYRDSKLTRICQEALGGNCKTFYLFTVTPSHIDFQETLHTLKFAERTKEYECQPKILKIEKITKIDWTNLPDFPIEEKKPDLIQGQQEKISEIIEGENDQTSS